MTGGLLRYCPVLCELLVTVCVEKSIVEFGCGDKVLAFLQLLVAALLYLIGSWVHVVYVTMTVSDRSEFTNMSGGSVDANYQNHYTITL